MKAAYIFIAFFLFGYSASFAQNNNNAAQQNAFREIQIKAGSAFSNPRSRGIVNRTRTHDSLSLAQLLNPDSLKNYIYRRSGNPLPPKKRIGVKLTSNPHVWKSNIAKGLKRKSNL